MGASVRLRNAATSPGDADYLRITLKANNIDGWSRCDDVTLMKYSDAFTVNDTLMYHLEAEVGRVLDAPSGELGRRLFVAFFNGSGAPAGNEADTCPEPVEGWSAADYQPSGSLLQSGEFDPPTGAATARAGMEAHLSNGWLDVDNVVVEHIDPAPALTRSYYSFGGQTVAVRVDDGSHLRKQAELKHNGKEGQEGRRTMALVLEKHMVITEGLRGGKPHLAETRITVSDVVIWHLRQGYALEEIAARYNLALAGAYAAIAYYYDHREEVGTCSHGS